MGSHYVIQAGLTQDPPSTPSFTLIVIWQGSKQQETRKCEPRGMDSASIWSLKKQHQPHLGCS
jgi:hypothetical protein